MTACRQSSAAFLAGLGHGSARAFAGAGDTPLHDAFNGPSVDPKLWHIPTFTASGDGTFVGRTQCPR